MTPPQPPAARWEAHAREWRAPEQIASQWRDATDIDGVLLEQHASRDWWNLLADLGLTLLVTREYEHLLMGLSTRNGRPHVTYLPLPHPSGIAVEPEQGSVHVASTRNPNQVFEFQPALGSLDRGDSDSYAGGDRPLVPIRSRFVPGCTYLHDLALVGGRLHANAVGMNAVVRLDDAGQHIVWWPTSIERRGKPDLSRNYLQLNSIAAGDTIEESFFSASSEAPGSRRPGHRNYPVDGRGVIFSGATREPVARGLTRPHSARFHDGALWVANSGYGEVGVVRGDHFEPVVRLPGWTRGLAFSGHVAFVGVSRVIARFRRYAPGLDVDRSVCGVYAIDTRTGETLASLTWPEGNQIFAIESLAQTVTLGFPFSRATRSRPGAARRLFYSFTTTTRNGTE